MLLNYHKRATHTQLHREGSMLTEHDTRICHPESTAELTLDTKTHEYHIDVPEEYDRDSLWQAVAAAELWGYVALDPEDGGVEVTETGTRLWLTPIDRDIFEVVGE